MDRDDLIVLQVLAHSRESLISTIEECIKNRTINECIFHMQLNPGQNYQCVITSVHNAICTEIFHYGYGAYRIVKIIEGPMADEMLQTYDLAMLKELDIDSSEKPN